jgi:hypothetical protein
MIDLTRYDDKTVLQHLKHSPSFVSMLAEAGTWEEVKGFIENEKKWTCTDSQLDFVKKKLWDL